MNSIRMGCYSCSIKEPSSSLTKTNSCKERSVPIPPHCGKMQKTCMRGGERRVGRKLIADAKWVAQRIHCRTGRLQVQWGEKSLTHHNTAETTTPERFKRRHSSWYRLASLTQEVKSVKSGWVSDVSPSLNKHVAADRLPFLHPLYMQLFLHYGFPPRSTLTPGVQNSLFLTVRHKYLCWQEIKLSIWDKLPAENLRITGLALKNT